MKRVLVVIAGCLMLSMWGCGETETEILKNMLTETSPQL